METTNTSEHIPYVYNYQRNNIAVNQALAEDLVLDILSNPIIKKKIIEEKNNIIKNSKYEKIYNEKINNLENIEYFRKTKDKELLDNNESTINKAIIIE
jgi:hypothetical protein